MNYCCRLYLQSFQAVTPQQCAQLCLNDAGCLSFDAGVVGNFQQGNCFLSYDNSMTDPNDTIISISQLNFFERLNTCLPFLTATQSQIYV